MSEWGAKKLQWVSQAHDSLQVLLLMLVAIGQHGAPAMGMVDVVCREWLPPPLCPQKTSKHQECRKKYVCKIVGFGPNSSPLQEKEHVEQTPWESATSISKVEKYLFHHRTAFARRSGRLGEGVKSRNFCWQQWEIKGHYNVHVFKGQQICISLSSSAVFAYGRLLKLFLRGSWSVMLDHAGGGWRFPTLQEIHHPQQRFSTKPGSRWGSIS